MNRISVLEWKEKMKQFYSRYDRLLISILKLIVTFSMLMILNRQIEGLNTIPYAVPIFLGAALLAALLPQGFINAAVGAVLLYRMYQAGTEALLVLGLTLIIMACLYFVFRPGNSCLLSLSMVLTLLKVPGVLVVPVGMIFNPFAVVPLAFGMILGNYVDFVTGHLTSLMGNTETTLMQKVVFLTDGLITEKDVWLAILAMTVTVCFVYMVRKLSVNYSWMIASIAGAVINIVIVLFGGYMLGIETNPLWTVLGTLIGLAGILLYYFLVKTLDYSQTEQVSFEDDDYIYYVKAVPKMSVAKMQPKVKTISERVDAKEHKLRTEKEQEQKNKQEERQERLDETNPAIVIPVASAEDIPETAADYEEPEEIRVEKVGEERLVSQNTESEKQEADGE